MKAAPDVTELVERTPATKRGRQLEVLQRLTVMVDDPALLHTLVSTLLPLFFLSHQLSFSLLPATVIPPNIGHLVLPPYQYIHWCHFLIEENLRIKRRFWSLKMFLYPSHFFLQSSPAAESYDLLAVCPASDRVFLQACSVLPIDIVTFNFAEKLPFVLKFSQLSQVCYRS